MSEALLIYDYEAAQSLVSEIGVEICANPNTSIFEFFCKNTGSVISKFDTAKEAIAFARGLREASSKPNEYKLPDEGE